MLCRYLYQHGYDLTLNELVDQISAPIIRKILLNAMHTSVDSSPTPAEYFHMINEGSSASLLIVTELVTMMLRHLPWQCNPLTSTDSKDALVLALCSAHPSA